MKKLLPLLFILGFISVQAQQKRSLTPVPNMVADANYRIGCSLFNDPNNYTTGSSFTFNAPVNNNSYLVGPGGASYGCLYSVPNQAWFIITVNTSGNLYFNFSNTYGYDVDAAIWGPIVNNDMGNACSSTQSYPLTCDYDTGRPDLWIYNAQAGQKYVMLVTNYSNASTAINITQPSGGSVTYAMVNLPNCSMIPTASISGTSTTITEGQSATLNLNFTGSSPWNYTLSDGTIGTSYSSSTSLTVYPTASQTYTVNSVGNLCGTNGGTGSVGISVVRSVDLKTCLPLDGNATDSKLLNDGTLQNGVSTTTNRNNESGKALQFDGIDDYVSLLTNQLNNNTFTFAAWVKLDVLPSSVNTEAVALTLGGGWDEHFLGVEYYNGAPTWKFSSNGANVYSTATVNTNWHLLVGVRSGGQIKLYVDGLLTGTSSVSGSATYGTPLLARIGSSNSNYRFFKGKIDDVKIFSSSLIEPEILLLQNYTSCNNVVNDTFISLQSISTSVICAGNSFIVRALSNGLITDNETQFSVELSDINGSFTNPTTIGSSIFLPVTVTIPNDVVGGNYKIRIRYGAYTSLNSFDIFINKASSYNIAGAVTLNDGQSTILTLNFTGTGPWNYILSDGLSGVATTSPWQIVVSPDQTTTYSLNSAQNVCGYSSANGNTSATVTVNFTKQLVTCLPFNANASDEKGNNTLTVNGPILAENRYGQINSAYAFNGSTDYMEYSTNLLRKREYTMSAWVLASSIPGNTRYILSQGETGTNTFQGLAMTSYGWEFHSYSNNGLSSAYSSTGFAANQWVHLTAVRTYTHMKLYVNGNLVSTVSNNSLIPFKSSDIGRIGANSSSLGNYFNGKIDDVRLYKGALNDEEVYALYANTGSCPIIENSAIIVSRGLNPTTVCAGNTVSVSYSLSNVSVSSGSPLNVQLSDQNGSFANPVNIGSGFVSPITATIPANTVGSNFYRIRLVSTSGTPVTSVNSSGLTVSGSLPTAVISGGASIPFGGTTNLTVSFTGIGPWTYALNNGSSSTTSVSPVSIPVSPFSTVTYTVSYVSNTCGTGTSTGSAVVTVAPNISLGSIGNSFCQGQTFSVPFVANYTPTSDFKVELSNANGSFTSPTTIGTGTSSPISVTIPNNAPEGIAYKIRIVSTSPVYASPEFTNLTILTKPTVAIAGTTTIYYGQSANLTLTFTGSGPWTYAINNGSSQVTSNNPLVLAVSPTITTTYTVTSFSNDCGNGTINGSATVTVDDDPYLISCYLFNGNVNDGKGSNHGTNSGVTYTTDRFNNANSALLFDSPTDFVQIPTSQLGNGDAYTFSVWFNMSELSSASGRHIFTLSPNTYDYNLAQGLKLYDGYGYGVNPPIFPYFRANCSVGYTCDNRIGMLDLDHPDADDRILVNTWNQITVTRKNNVVKLYKNGILLNTVTMAPRPDLGGATLIGYIGKDLDNIGLGGTFIGKIDDIKIYRNALNDAQVVTLYNQTNCDDIGTIPYLNLETISTTNLCAGGGITIHYKSKGITSPVKVQLSDANGSFASPTQIGTGTSSPISVNIPENQTAGNAYKVRLVSSDNVPLVSLASAAITISNLPTATISGTRKITLGQSANLTVSFTGNGPWTYKINYGVSQTTSTNPLTIPVSPTITTTYTVTSLSNSCGTGTTSGSAVITVTNDPYLISCYLFNGNVNDGHGDNHGTASAVTYTTDRFNNPNSALSLSGAFNSYAEIPLDELVNTSAYTFSLWYNSAQYSSFEGTSIFAIMPEPDEVISNSYGKSQSVSLRTQYFDERETAAYFGTVCTNNTQCYKPFGTVNDFISLNTWYQLTVTRENNVVKLYRNGILLNTIPVIADNSNLGNLKAYIGKYFWEIGLGYSFKGKIDDLKIYSKALNATQVLALYIQSNCEDILNTKFITLDATPTSICKGSTISVAYFAYGITSPVKIQLSDANGGFTNPVELGSGSTSPILVQIPSNLATGANYRIRVVSSDNVPVISNLSAPLSVTQLSTATISGTKTIQGGESASFTIAFTGGGPWDYSINSGTSQTTSTNPLTISVSPGVTTTYTITSLSNACGSGAPSGSAVITVSNDPYLISCYSFAGNVNDGKGDNHGTSSGISYTADRFNNPNGALYFNGQTGNYVQIPLDELPNTTAYSLSLWFSTADYVTLDGVNLMTIMPTPTTSLSTYFNKVQAIALRDYYMKSALPIPTYGSFCSNEESGVGCYYSFGPETDVTDANKWYHLVITRLNNVVKFYRDGVLLRTMNVPTASSGLGNLVGYIGKDLSTAGVGKAFKGKLDDIQIYRRALSLGQIRALYNNSNSCFDASKFTCLAEVTFDSILNGQQILTSKGKITGISTIQTGSNIYFDAKNAILLQPGFKTEPNTTFTAKPGEGCVD